jgi:hypothetical protein
MLQLDIEQLNLGLKLFLPTTSTYNVIYNAQHIKLDCSRLRSVLIAFWLQQQYGLFIWKTVWLVEVVGTYILANVTGITIKSFHATWSTSQFKTLMRPKSAINHRQPYQDNQTVLSQDLHEEYVLMEATHSSTHPGISWRYLTDDPAGPPANPPQSQKAAYQAHWDDYELGWIS